MHRPSRLGSWLVCCAILLWAGSARADATALPARTYDLCARGLAADPAKPFTQTMRVRLELQGPEIEPQLLKPLAAQLIKAALWDGKADQVFVEQHDAAECAAGAGNESTISLAISPAQIDALRAEIDRGEGLMQSVLALARSASTSRRPADPEGEAQKRWLRVFYASNRNFTATTLTEEAFGTARVDAVAYGSVEVSIRHEPGMRELESPAMFRLEHATELDRFETAARLVPLQKDAWLEALRRRAERFGRPGVLLFIHGYNVGFVDAARRAAQLAYDLAFPGPTVFFAWPSDASTIRYLYDGRDADNSQVAAATVLGDLAALQPGGPVYVVAHSMGNRVLTAGLLRLLQEDPAKRHAFREIVLAAPDVDQETFRLNIAPKILNTGPRFTLYASSKDLALHASQFVQGGKRLGFGGESLYVASGLDSVDASAVTREFFALNHSYFGDKRTVLADLFHVIRSVVPEKRPHLRRVTVPAGEGWAFD